MKCHAWTAHIKDSCNKIDSTQQRLVPLYKNADKWVKDLYSDLIDRLYEFLGQDLEGQLVRLQSLSQKRRNRIILIIHMFKKLNSLAFITTGKSCLE